MGELKTDQNGSLDVSSVATLSREEIADWVRRRLRGEDYLIASDVKQGEPSYYLLASIYPNLDRDSRSYMRSGVAQFLDEMSREEQTWRGDAGHSLLLLAQRLREAEFVRPIRKMAESSVFSDQASRTDYEGLHLRVLQSLVALKWRGSPQFWLTQFARCPRVYGPVVFAGLGMISIRNAMQLLPRIEWDDASVKRKMRVALRGLLPGHALEDIADGVSGVLPRLSRSDRLAVESMLPELRGVQRSRPQHVLPGTEIRGTLAASLAQTFKVGRQELPGDPPSIASTLLQLRPKPDVSNQPTGWGFAVQENLVQSARHGATK
jgi:hypothetical protein